MRAFPRLGVLLVLISCLLATEAQAQVRVALEIERRLHIPYEPIVALVSIQNLSGKELLLQDDETINWFAFQIETVEGRRIAPRDSSYSLQPVQIGPGQTVKRALNLTPLYPLDEYGSYRLRAVVHVPEYKAYFSSNPEQIDITEGRKIWQQTVGVPMSEPDGGSLRTLTLMTHRAGKRNSLYLRIEDKDQGLIFATHRLGTMVSYSEPRVEIDGNNQVHVLHNAMPTIWMHSHIGLRGEVLKRDQYLEDKKKPILSASNGAVAVVGARQFDPKALAAQQAEAEQNTPSISDRPVPLPNPFGSNPTP